MKILHEKITPLCASGEYVDKINVQYNALSSVLSGFVEIFKNGVIDVSTCRTLIHSEASHFAGYCTGAIAFCEFADVSTHAGQMTRRAWDLVDNALSEVNNHK